MEAVPSPSCIFSTSETVIPECSQQFPLPKFFRPSTFFLLFPLLLLLLLLLLLFLSLCCFPSYCLCCRFNIMVLSSSKIIPTFVMEIRLLILRCGFLIDHLIRKTRALESGKISVSLFLNVCNQINRLLDLSFCASRPYRTVEE